MIKKSSARMFFGTALIALVALTGVAATIVVGTILMRADAAERVPLSDVSHIHGIAVDPRDSERLVLATHHGIFLAGGDGIAERISGERNDYMGFTPHPGDPGILYASGHPTSGGNMGFIASRDGGATWRPISEGVEGPVDFHAMDVSAADPQVIYGVYGAIQVSRDAGKSWQIAGTPPADVFDLAASALDSDLVYAATRNGLMVSRDGAKSWESTGPAGQPATMVQVGSDGAVYAFVLGNGLLRAPGAALNWQQVTADLGERVLLHLAIDRTNPRRMFAVTDEGRILTSTNGGRNWAAVSP